MQILTVGFFSVALASALAAGPRPGWVNARPVGQAEGIFSYSLEKGDLHYEDLLTLSDGSKCLGKAMEWADQVLLFEVDGTPRVFDVSEVEQFEFRRAMRHKSRSPLPDLTVGHIERLPRDPSWHDHVVSRDGLELPEADVGQVPWHPAAGSEVTFRVHVLNSGASASSEVRCRVLIDGTELSAAVVPPLETGREHVVEVSWPWHEGRHMIRVELDPDGQVPEALRWNNVFVEAIDALAVTVVVASDRYEAFKETVNLVDSFCFEDWIQYQIRVLNALFAASIHPSPPQGILERVRCDRIVVLDDPTDPQQRSRWMAGLHSQGQPNGLAEFAARWVLEPLSERDVPVYDALRVDWQGLQHLAGQLGLVDLSTTDTTIRQCLVLDQHERYVQRRHLFPWPRTMMYAAGGFPLDERSAAFLNQTRGRPRGLQGDALYQLPEKITVEVRSNVGSRLADVQVDVFQLMSEGEYAGAIAG
ncbi:MAG: CARDB domain-containing protein, partial [Dehalococcoidia bacterium]